MHVLTGRAGYFSVGGLRGRHSWPRSQLRWGRPDQPDSGVIVLTCGPKQAGTTRSLAGRLRLDAHGRVGNRHQGQRSKSIMRNGDMLLF